MTALTDAKQINFLAHVLLTLILLPSLARAETPRIVCTTSSFHYNGRFDLANFNGELGKAGPGGVYYYQNNKLWFQVWLTELQRRLLLHDEYRHITVNGVHPGYVNSGIWSLNFNQGAFEFVLKMFANLLAINCQQGSLALTHAAAAVECGPDPKVQGVGVEGGKGGGRFFNRVWELEAMPHTRDADCRLRVWRKVNDELHLKEKGLLDVLGVWSTD